MTFSLNPYKSDVPSIKEEVFDPFNNLWFQFNSSTSLDSFIESYKDINTEYLFVDCTRNYPLSSDFGFLKDLIGSIVTSNHLNRYSSFNDLQNIWNEIKALEFYESELRVKIYSFFENITLDCQVIVLIFSDLHLIADNIHDKEIHILKNITSSNNPIKFWIISDTKVDCYNSKLREKFFNSFKVANDLQKSTIFKCASNIKKHTTNNHKPTNMGKIKLFISYAHADEEQKNRFVQLLNELTINGLLEEWNDQQLTPGLKWDKEIKRKLEESQIVLFLITGSFFQSDYVNDVEIKNTIDRYNQNEVLIVPIILEECDFKYSALKEYQALPKNAQPISTWNSEIDAWLDVIAGLKRSIDYLKQDEKGLIEKVLKLKEEATTINQGGENNINIVNNSGSINLFR